MFAPGTPEVEIGHKDGLPVAVDGEKGRMGKVVLTNDRIIFASSSLGPSGNILGDVVAAALESRADSKAGGPAELVRLAELRSGGVDRRRMLPDLYELRLADGGRVRLHRSLRKKWDPTIRRLLAERHGLTVRDDGDGWRVDAS